MRSTLAIAGKELRSYFFSPVAYVVTAAFLVISGYLFSASMGYYQTATMRDTFGNMAVTLLLMAPVLTMRILAEEQRSGTIELLLTSPVRDLEVVIGKYLACLALLAVMLVLTLLYPLILVMFGHPDFGPIISGYAGIFLTAAAFLSIGLMASSFTQNQIVAGVVAFTVILLLWLIGFAASVATSPLSDVLTYLSLPDRLNDYMQGIIDSRSVIYQLTLVLLPLFITVKVLESRRWR